MALPIYMAPLEGITDATYRRVHHACFGGVQKYFIPFISPTQNLCFTQRDLSAIAPEHNTGLYAVPQILTKSAEHFLWAAQALYDMGYGEVNLNVGCPSGTVTAKGKGAGILANVPELGFFLDDIFAHAPLRISIKTRIGFCVPDEFERLLPIFARYPIHELIIHPRTRGEFYSGTPHRDVYAAALAQTALPLVYNGDLFTTQDCNALTAQCPDTRALMLGRGLIANPALAQQLAGGDALTLPALRTFLNELEAAYLSVYPKNVALGRLREVAKHIVCCFDAPDKPHKALRKATSLDAYHAALCQLFDAHELRENAGFIPSFPL